LKNRKIPEDGNIADHIVDRVCDGLTVEEIVEAFRRAMDIALNHDHVLDRVQSQIIGRICWRFGLEPPDSVQDDLM